MNWGSRFRLMGRRRKALRELDEDIRDLLQQQVASAERSAALAKAQEQAIAKWLSDVLSKQMPRRKPPE
jgi:hypothetical protein